MITCLLCDEGTSIGRGRVPFIAFNVLTCCKAHEPGSQQNRVWQVTSSALLQHGRTRRVTGEVRAERLEPLPERISDALAEHHGDDIRISARASQAVHAAILVHHHLPGISEEAPPPPLQ